MTVSRAFRIEKSVRASRDEMFAMMKRSGKFRKGIKSHVYNKVLEHIAKNEVPTFIHIAAEIANAEFDTAYGKVIAKDINMKLKDSNTAFRVAFFVEGCKFGLMDKKMFEDYYGN